PDTEHNFVPEVLEEDERGGPVAGMLFDVVQSRCGERSKFLRSGAVQDDRIRRCRNRRCHSRSRSDEGGEVGYFATTVHVDVPIGDELPQNRLLLSREAGELYRVSTDFVTASLDEGQNLQHPV